MKKKLLISLAISLLAVTGCQSKEETAPTEQQQVTEAIEEVFGDYIIQPNDALKTVFVKSWDVTGTDDVYVLEMDGTGKKNEEAFTYECGFNEENQIVISFTMEGSDEGTIYVATSDTTGYGIDLQPVADGEFLNFFPTNMELLEDSDERVTSLVGSWKDDNKNEYIFDASGELLIKGKDGDTPGTWCSMLKEETGACIVNLLVEGGSLEFEYTVSEDGKMLSLYNRGAEIWYYWYR